MSSRSIALSASGRLLFAGYPGRDTDSQQCLVWDTVTGTVAATLAGHDNDVSAVAVAPDGMSVCTGSWDTVIRVRAAPSGDWRGCCPGRNEGGWVGSAGRGTRARNEGGWVGRLHTRDH